MTTAEHVPSGQSPYAEPRLITDPGACAFYHTMEIPGYGIVHGEWDMRDGIEPYLGDVRVTGKRVLDVGTASGFLTFSMEQRGAEVVSYDLAPTDRWDIVPFARTDLAAYVAERRALIHKLNNGYWLAHRAFGSRARLVHGTCYAIPRALGSVDVATCGNVLLHLRDPFAALQEVLSLTTETVIVTDVMPRRHLVAYWLRRRRRPRLTFLPDARRGEPQDTWWILSPDVVRAFLEVLGFEDTRVRVHWQRYQGRRRALFTVVGRRTRPAPRLEPD